MSPGLTAESLSVRQGAGTEADVTRAEAGGRMETQEACCMESGKKITARVILAGCAVIALILVLGTVWMGKSAQEDSKRMI